MVLWMEKLLINEDWYETYIYKVRAKNTHFEIPLTCFAIAPFASAAPGSVVKKNGL